METPTLTTLPGLARELKLPRTWLAAEARGGRIPFLKVGRRLRFNPDAVRRVLAERAAAGESRGGSNAK
ncbi:MAG: helix-turn-helix domain-containing protein [Phycisphaerae bacterium]|nr:helix-turn-helix domain-containing protein [Phycisphaerae bacterium]